MTTSLKTNKANSIKRSKLSVASSLSIPRSLPFEARRLLKRVQTFAATHTLWQEHARILVAVSGGPDSCCLIDILAFLSRKYSFKLAIAHVNYQLRGADSVADEQFVKALAQQYALPCFIKRYPKNSTQRDEEVLRNFRYTFFEDLSKKHRFDSIALGHQKNDQAETFLLNLLRGSGPLGLAGMPPKYRHRIRPLLVLNREEVLRYLEARSLPFRLDTSNHDTRYTRNRIRHELLPLLEERFNPNIIGTLARSATLFQNSLTKQPRSQNIPHGKRSKKTASYH